MKKTKRMFSAMLAILLAVVVTVIGLPVTAIAVSNPTAPIYVQSTTGKALWAEGCIADTDNNIDAVKWYEKNGKYYWFLPSSANLSNLTVYHNFNSVKINGTTITSGNSYNIFENGKTYSVVADNRTYSLVVQKATGIGSVFFTTESGSMNYIHEKKGNEESGDIVVIDYDGSVSYDKGLDSIKGRGNTTWQLKKKPYNIKLDKKASLMGMDKSKKWCLLANAQEHSMIRNTLMYNLGYDAGLDFAPDSRFVDVYANGEYLGTYQLSQKIEAGDGELVDITDLEGNTEDAVAEGTGLDDVDLEDLYGKNKYTTKKMQAFNIPYNPKDITGGYLLEFVVAIDEPSYFITNGGQSVHVKAPEIASVEQVQYISSFMQDLENALYSSTGYNSKGKHYTDYLDMESAAIMYLLQEFSVNIDGGISSCYFYKDSDLTGDGKLHASPCWDFDVALGNLDKVKDNVNMLSYDKWFIKDSYRYSETRTVFAQLCQHEDFVEKVAQLWKERFVPALAVATGNAEPTGRLKSMDQYHSLLASSAVMNYTRWDIKDNLLVSSAGSTVDSQFQYLKNFVNGRISFLNSGLLDVASAKAEAIKVLDNKISEYSKEYPANVIAEMKKVAEAGKTEINSATTSMKVNTVLNKVLTDIDACKVDTVYFDNSKTQWEEVYFYSWGGSLSTDWPGVKMTDMGNNIYSYTIDGKLSNIIFNNGKSETTNDKRQTYNLTFQGNNTVYTADQAEEKYDNDKSAYMHNGQWSKYTPPVDNNVVYGDVSGDGSVKLVDAVLILKYMVGLVDFSEKQRICGDVTGDGNVTLSDAIVIQKHLVGLVETLPIA